jgi:hypothetical protein
VDDDHSRRTSAPELCPNAATKIIGAGEIFLRNARVMNDQNEIKLGRDCVNRFLVSNALALSDALNAIQPNLFGDLMDLWNREHIAQIEQSYIGCFTAQQVDDNLGSPYHWDHYGNTALCFDSAFLCDEPALLSLYLVKVTYGNVAVLAGLDQLLSILQSNKNDLCKVAPNILLSFLRHRLFFESVASKGDAFLQEQEWRLIHAPFLFASADLQPENRLIKGQSESLYPLKMRTPIGTDMDKLEVRNFVKKVLIHPEKEPQSCQLRFDLISQLKYHGCNDAENRVKFVEV